ncbi:SWPV2-ORF287 [Shearwaterpox virus]|uniref:SWPV2-ORF287 n=1 Tax=Shearwaterpox virus TaxID=1974596 RepID=A0A1V0QGR2_CNPV|nr:SWPV2-ORF287 [Shearwaterpox virus]QRM15580.1 ankyrin repeat protein [Mudlarkpox virus]QRM15933.1 ankyrin repeat protein [Penguinpox virus 2]QRM16270.1 ankyrin repeat protein [Albatrosspox virus]
MWTLYRAICTENIDDVMAIMNICRNNEILFYRPTYQIPYIPLHQAVDCRSVKLVEHLIKDSSVNIEDSKGITPLHIICCYPKIKEIIKFIEFEHDYYDDTLIMYKKIIKNDTYGVLLRVELIKLFLKQDTRVVDFNRLRMKIMEDEIYIANILIHHGACINCTDIEGNTPLHFAVKHNNFNLTNLLLENGAIPNIRNDDNITPLQIAINNNNIDILRILIDTCKHSNIAIDRCLIYNSIHQRNTESIKLLTDSGIDINSVDEEYDFTPLHYAASYVIDYSVVKCLIALGADVNKKSGLFLTTPLFGSLRNKQITELLIDNGADVNCMDCNGNTPIMSLYSKYKDIKIDVIKIIVAEISIQESLKGITKECETSHNFTKDCNDSIQELTSNLGFKKNIDFINSSTILKSIKTECDSELSKMKETRINGRSMYSILIGNEKHHLYKMINAINIDKLYITDNFPLYERIINTSINNAIVKNTQMLKCFNIMNNILEDKKTDNVSWQCLPAEIKWDIVTRLSTDDVSKLLE